MIIRPQPLQEKFLSSSADIVLFGGAAGGGKTWAIVMDSTRGIKIPDFRATIIRKSYAQIFESGALWDEAKKLYLPLDAQPFKTPKPRFLFPSGAEINFKHSSREEDVEHNFQGLQSDIIYIDELATGFSKREFLYILSRLRSMTNINSYLRATCNPNPASFLRQMISWWLDENEIPDPSKSGVIRYFVVVDENFIWADTKEELQKKYNRDVLSFTFIHSNVYDNKALLEKEPKYISKLQNLSQRDQLALLQGSWAVVDNPLALFKQSNINDNRIETYDHIEAKRIVIGIDPAGSDKKSSDETGIIVAALGYDNKVYILEDNSGRYTPDNWANIVINLYDKYQADCIVIERNYGGDMASSTIISQARILGRHDIRPKQTTSSRGKEIRAEPVSMLYSNNEVIHVGYNLHELEKQMTTWVPKQTQKSPDRLDALVFAVNELSINKKRRVRALVVN